MKGFEKHISRLLTLLLVAFLFTSCGKKEESELSTSSSSSTSALPQPSVNCGGSSCID